MAFILEPILGKRLPDRRWIPGRKELPSGKRSARLEEILLRRPKVLLRLRPKEHIDALIDTARGFVSQWIEQIEERGEMRYPPDVFRQYDSTARLHFVAEEDHIVLPVGETVEVDAEHAMILLRYEPEGFGYLVEEIDRDTGRASGEAPPELEPEPEPEPELEPEPEPEPELEPEPEPEPPKKKAPAKKKAAPKKKTSAKKTTKKKAPAKKKAPKKKAATKKKTAAKGGKPPSPKESK
jgi:hypothetical protein